MLLLKHPSWNATPILNDLARREKGLFLVEAASLDA
jgi:hypothetical protein